MEKYRKFEDPKNGINPYVPEVFSKRNFLIKSFFILQFFFGLPIMIAFLSLFLVFVILQSLRHILLLSRLKRIIEVFLCKIFGKIFLVLTGVWSINQIRGKLDPRTPNIIFSSQSSMIDWLLLMYRHSPKFLWIVKSENSDNDYLTELSYCDLFFFAAGLKFLLIRNKPAYKPFDIEKYIATTNHAPVVIFPENTKTNRKGVLSIRSNVMDLIYNLANEHQRLLLRSEIIVKKLSNWTMSPNNTTDYLGIIRLFCICSQLYYEVDIVTQDILITNLEKSQIYDKLKYNRIEEYLDSIIQAYLYEPRNRNVVSMNCLDHMAFLEYYNKTHSDFNYAKQSKSS